MFNRKTLGSHLKAISAGTETPKDVEGLCFKGMLNHSWYCIVSLRGNSLQVNYHPIFGRGFPAGISAEHHQNDLPYKGILRIY